MKNIITLAFILITVLFGQNAYAQAKSYTVKGIILDEQTSHSAPFVYVHLEELNRTAVTSNTGQFELKNIPNGTYTLTVHHVGYNDYSKKIEISNKDLELTINLKASVYTGQEIEVTGQRSAVSGSNMEHASKKVYGEELRRSLNSTLSQTLSSLPGFDQRTQGAAPGRPVIRGLGGERVVILQDGMSSGDISAQTSDHAVTIDPASAEEIEIARGPAALAFGANAIGGVINVVKNQIPTSVPNKANGSFTMSGKSVNKGISGALNTQIPVGSFAVLADLSARTSDNTHTPIGVLENSAYQTLSNTIGVSFVKPWGYSGISATIYDNKYGIPPDPYGHTNGVDIEMSKHQVDFKSEIIFNKDFLKLLEIEGSFKDYKHKELEGLDTHGNPVVGTAYHLRTSNANLRFKHNDVGKFNNGIFGVTGQFEDYIVEGTGMPPAQNLNIGAYLIEEVDFGNLHLELGARYDFVGSFTNSDDKFYPIGITTGAIDSTNYKNRTFNNLSGAVAAIYSFDNGFALGGSVLRSFRAPTMEELYSEGPHLASYSYEIGNPDLNAERAWAKEIFVQYSRNNFNFETALFHNSFDNYLFAENTGRTNAQRADLFDYQYTGTRANLYGLEISGVYKFLRYFKTQASISYTEAQQKVKNDQGETEWTPLPQIPPLKAQATFSFSKNKIEVGTNIIHAFEQDRIGAFETKTAEYTTVDLFGQIRIEGNRNMHSISVNINNLLNTEYYNHLSRIKEITPEPGLNLNILYRLYF